MAVCTNANHLIADKEGTKPPYNTPTTRLLERLEVIYIRKSYEIVASVSWPYSTDASAVFFLPLWCRWYITLCHSCRGLAHIFCHSPSDFHLYTKNSS